MHMANARIVLNEDDVPGANLFKEPSNCSVEELKQWLHCHGLKRTGGKDELVERVRFNIGIIKVDSKIDGGKWYEYKKNGTTEVSEDLFPNNGWKNFASRNIPSMFNYGHVYHYLIETV